MLRMKVMEYSKNLMNFKVNSRRFRNNDLGEGGLSMKLLTSIHVRVGELIYEKQCITLVFVKF